MSSEAEAATSASDDLAPPTLTTRRPTASPYTTVTVFPTDDELTVVVASGRQLLLASVERRSVTQLLTPSP